MKTSSKSRLVRDGRRETAPEFGLAEKHILNIERLAIEPEAMLGRTSIADQFDAEFFTTNFWFMWCTTFAFQPWHSAVEFKRYLVRFAHMVARFSRLEGIMRTVYNQHDSMVRPLHKCLFERGVRFRLNTRVTNIGLDESDRAIVANQIAYEQEGKTGAITVGPDDFVLVTLGSMTEASSLGAMDAAPTLLGKVDGGAWTLWDKIARDRPDFGRPSVFSNFVDESKWVSFTTTPHDPIFLRRIFDFTGNVPGEGGANHLPEFQLAGLHRHSPSAAFSRPTGARHCLLGYGLAVDKPGNFVKKPMSVCTGREIMTEILGHLRIESDASQILDAAICIPCLMPFITSQFLRRESGDRPQVMPKGSKNLAFMGQFCELPDDEVFTVGYSIRSAQTAVYSLLQINREPPAVYKGKFDPRVLFRAFLALHDIRT